MLPYDKPVRLIGVFAFLAAFCEALSFYAAALYAYHLTGSVLAVAADLATIAPPPPEIPVDPINAEFLQSLQTGIAMIQQQFKGVKRNQAFRGRVGG